MCMPFYGGAPSKTTLRVSHNTEAWLALRSVNVPRSHDLVVLLNLACVLF